MCTCMGLYFLPPQVPAIKKENEKLEIKKKSETWTPLIAAIEKENDIWPKTKKILKSQLRRISNIGEIFES